MSSSSSLVPEGLPPDGPPPCDDCDDCSDPSQQDNPNPPPSTCDKCPDCPVPPPPDDPGDDCDDDLACPCDDGQSDNPVVYAYGAIAMPPRRDIWFPGCGLFAHIRTFNNRTFRGGPNGYNMFIRQLAYAAAPGTARGLVFDPNVPYWFDKSGTNYIARYNRPGLYLVRDDATKTITFIRVFRGKIQRVVFNDTDALVAPGRFVSHRDARGVETTVAAQTAGRIDEMQRSFTSGGVTTYQSMLYSYYTSGAAVDKLQYVTYRKGSSSTGPWTDIKRVAYTYYSATDGNGGEDELVRHMTVGRRSWTRSVIKNAIRRARLSQSTIIRSLM